MDRSSVNSLNSKRNLKLPPIQGAVPATLYGERNWNTTTRTVQHHRRRSRPRNDLGLASNFQSLNRVDLNSRVEFPREKAAAVFTSPPRQHVQINLGHEFPKSYTVLPPINHHKKTNTITRPRKPPVKQIHHNNVELSIEQKKSPVNDEPKPQATSCAEAVDKLSEKRRERLQEKLKTSANNNTNKESIKELDDTSTGDNCNNNNNSNNYNNDCDNSRTEEEQVDITKRKKSPTFFVHVKCKRFGRRNAVCTENEPTLVNVTDQLKEIFLRRNMEEMYLI